jgi:hypothetical protein
MARPVRLLSNFEQDLDRSIALVDTVRELRFPPSSGRQFPALPNFQVALIGELAFLRCFLAWENFLEEMFMAYAQGQAAPGGTVFPSYLSAPTQVKTRAIVRGERRAFVSWADASQVTARAKMYFEDGEPFDTVLGTAGTALADMVTVRNRIAHRGGTAAEKFLTLVRQRLGSVQPGMSPGRFLLGPGTNPANRRIDEYLTVLRTAGNSLAP